MSRRQIRGQTRDQTWDPTRDQTWGQTRDQTWDPTRDQSWDPPRAQTLEPTLQRRMRQTRLPAPATRPASAVRTTPAAIDGPGPDRGHHARALDTLARSGPEDVRIARAHRDHLLRAARTLVVATGGRPGQPCPSGPACDDDAHAEVCGLVHRLAGIAAGPVAVIAVATARHDLEVALTAAVDAVRCCRQTDHGAGRCWFTVVPGQDGCGEVLRAAHAIG